MKFEYSIYRYSLICKHLHSNYLFTFQNYGKTQSIVGITNVYMVHIIYIKP